MIQVLIADDEALERMAMIRILLSAPIDEQLELVEAVNGNEALNIAQAQHIDIAFLDIKMPGLDGLAVAERVASMEDPPIIIMLTAYDYFSYARTALRFGVTDYLLKPASTSEVHDALIRAVELLQQDKVKREKEAVASQVEQKARDYLMTTIEQALRNDSVDTQAISQLVMLETGKNEWSCSALVIGTWRKWQKLL